MNGQRGYFVISLDFELMWGVNEWTVEQYGANVLGARKAIPMLLDLFGERNIHCTWAAVGLLLADTYEDLLSNMPDQTPNYDDTRISAYSCLSGIGKGEEDDPYHYGASLIRRITACDNQEIGSHTFSHYYTEEDGQSVSDFERDLAAAKKAAEKFGLNPVSLVLPRNQINMGYIGAMVRNGITSYRGNEKIPGCTRPRRRPAIRSSSACADWRTRTSISRRQLLCAFRDRRTGSDPRYPGQPVSPAIFRETQDARGPQAAADKIPDEICRRKRPCFSPVVASA
jgi:peptidoglycan/xylan/chitin deacetylase (PgdA/CDA1 family)